MTRREIELIQELIQLGIEQAMAGAFHYDYQSANRKEEIETELLNQSN